MRFQKMFFLFLLCVVVFPFARTHAKCGVNSISTERCPLGGWRTVEQCHDGVRRTWGGPDACISRQRYSVDRSVIRSFCENRCNPPILDCSQTPSLDNLMNAICTKLNERRPSIAVEDCVRDIEAVSVSDELGLAEGNNDITFAVIREAITAGTVSFDRDIYCDCTYRIRNLSCSAFGSSSFVTSLDELWEIEEMIPEQCGNDQYPGVLLPNGFNPITGETGN